MVLLSGRRDSLSTERNSADSINHRPCMQRLMNPSGNTFEREDRPGKKFVTHVQCGTTSSEKCRPNSPIHTLQSPTAASLPAGDSENGNAWLISTPILEKLATTFFLKHRGEHPSSCITSPSCLIAEQY
ncbi:hypothetical protein DM02DRAFT_126785 [Periconia macrospinosa]|uniref:Uncharacterized protein n=1 Tax=Periconia macrospinosa TaxID=97972 RepID=A0A2V1E438_9PLEO|nr:hypothetical protein DM02DRAFT_126785 [Periconia macrospinosa]